MNAVHSARKIESGAELLARLNTRPDLQCIDSFIFGDSSSLSSSSSSSSSGGQLVEIFGSEGVGKTELALHCAAKVCLPIMSKGVELNGKEAKVIFIDTDYKFSILRLAVILEKQIKFALSMRNHSYSKATPTKDDYHNNIGSDVCKNEKTCNIVPLNEQFQGPENVSAASQISSELKENLDLEQKTTIMDKELSVEDKVNHKDNYVEWTNSDIEEIINESLERVHVLKVSCSQQFLVSLLSLKNVIAEDHLYTLLIIDSISAFYMMDKVADSGTANLIEHKMAPISDAISQLVNSFGLTCLAISSAFFSGKRVPAKDGRGTVSDEGGKNLWMNSEYLGKCWVSTRRRKIILTRKEMVNVDGDVKTEEGNVVRAFCSLTKKQKCYAFQDDHMKEL